MSLQSPMAESRLRFGPFEFNAISLELRKDGLRIHIQDQPARVLAALIERRDDTVTREELQALLWPADTHVEFERGLNTAVAKLRQALNDSADQPRYVATVARRGYRFIALVESVPQARSLSPQGQDHQPFPQLAAVPRSRRRLWVGALVTASALGCAGFLLSRKTPPAAPRPSIRFIVPAPSATTIHPISSISPDGRTLAFVAEDSSGRRSLWIRAIDSEKAHRIERTDGAVAPFFSPDSAHVGFFAGGALQRVPVTGDEPRTLCSVTQPAGGAWNRAGVILFSQSGRLYRVSDQGGLPIELPRPPVPPGESRIEAWPHFLPDGRRFLVSSATHTQHVIWVRAEILLGQLDSARRKALTNAWSRAVLTPDGLLLFRRDDFLVAQSFDENREQLVGQPFTVAQDLDSRSGGVVVDPKPELSVAAPPATFSVSENGVLALHAKPPNRRQLSWFNRKGEHLGNEGEPGDYLQMALSPDCRRVVLTAGNGKSWLHRNLWLLDLSTKVLSQLTRGEGRDTDPVWSPDSSRVVYGSYVARLGEQVDLMELKLGDREPRQIYSDGQVFKPETWSGDGQSLIVRRNEQFAFRLPLSAGGKPVDLFPTPHFRSGFRFSPDGQWLAYSSNESGANQVYVSRYPQLRPTFQVSTDGGFTPDWRDDGRELFYISRQGAIVAVTVDIGASVDGTRRPKFGTPKTLFRTNARQVHMHQFAQVENGRRFLVLEALPSQVADERLVVVTNWRSTLKP